MLSLIHIILILVLNQSLYVVTNAQQDLKIEQGVWRYPTSQFLSTNSQPYISYNLHTRRKSPQEQHLFQSNFNPNKQNIKAIPSVNSFYDSIIHITPEPIQTNVQLNNKHNWNDITEGRSRPNCRNIAYSNEQPPVELHHGYRYVTPAMSFSNIDNLKNVIYNELGLSESHSSLSSRPQGFALQNPAAEIWNNISFLSQNEKNKADISLHETNFVGHQNFQNITILTPVKNLTFTYNYTQPNVLNNVLNQKVNQYSLNHKQISPEDVGNPVNKKSSYLSKYNEMQLSILHESDQISQNFLTENKPPETSFHLDVPLNFVSNFTETGNEENNSITTVSLNVSSVQPNKKKLALNIRPSIEVNIQPGNILSQSLSQSPDKLSDIGSNFLNREMNHDFMKAYNQQFQQYEHLENPPKNTFVNNKQIAENPKHNTGLNIPTISTISNVFKNNFNVESPHNIQPSDSSHSEVFNKVLPQIHVGGRPTETINENNKRNQNLQGPTQSFSFNNNPISQSEYKQPYTTLQQQYMPIQSLSQQNKIGNQIQNKINKDPTLISSPSYQTPVSNKHNKIFFPTNLFLIDPAKLVTKLPIESNQYPYSKPQETNRFSSNVHKRYPEHSSHTSFNNHIQNNSLKLFDGNNVNQIYAVQPNKKTPQIETHSNQLTNIYSFRPTFEVISELINPRTSNYRMDSSNITGTKALSDEFTSNKTPITYNQAQQNDQTKTFIVFPNSDDELRLPHLIYGPPI